MTEAHDGPPDQPPREEVTPPLGKEEPEAAPGSTERAKPSPLDEETEVRSNA